MAEVGRSERAFLFYSPPATRRSGVAEQSSADSAGGTSSLPAAHDSSSLSTVPFSRPSDDCGACINCLDKRKFGGPGLKKRGCLTKKTGCMRNGAEVSCGSETPLELAKNLSGPMMDADRNLASREIAGSVRALQEPGATPGTEAPSLRSTSLTCAESAPAVLPAAPLVQAPVSPKAKAVSPAADASASMTWTPGFTGSLIGARALENLPSVPDPGVQAAPHRVELEPNVELCTPTMNLASPLLASRGSGAWPSGNLRSSGLAKAAASDDDSERWMAEQQGASTSGALKAESDQGRCSDTAPFASVRLVGRGLGVDEHDDERAPLNELSMNKSMSMPSTPVGAMKTPEIDALVSVAMQSPLSEVEHLLEITPRLSDEQVAEMSPLIQLASLFEKTPRLPTGSKLSLLDAARSADDLDLPMGDDTPGQLRRDLRAVLQASPNFGALLSSRGGRLESQAMPPPAAIEDDKGAVVNNKARKRKLEASLLTEAMPNPSPSAAASTSEEHGAGSSSTQGMFEPIGEGPSAEDHLFVAELLDEDGLGIFNGRKKKLAASRPGKSSKAKEKGKPQTCRCDRSGCLKRYCVCFALGKTCLPECVCKGCQNNDDSAENKAKREHAIAEMQKKRQSAFGPRFTGDGADKVHQTGCNCKRSGCIKRYCECFQSGVRCSEKCKCCGCSNPHGVNPESKPSLTQQTNGPSDGLAEDVERRLSGASESGEELMARSPRAKGNGSRRMSPRVSQNASPSTAALIAAAAAVAAAEPPVAPESASRVCDAFFAEDPAIAHAGKLMRSVTPISPAPPSTSAAMLPSVNVPVPRKLDIPLPQSPSPCETDEASSRSPISPLQHRKSPPWRPTGVGPVMAGHIVMSQAIVRPTQVLEKR